MVGARAVIVRDRVTDVVVEASLFSRDGLRASAGLKHQRAPSKTLLQHTDVCSCDNFTVLLDAVPENLLKFTAYSDRRILALIRKISPNFP